MTAEPPVISPPPEASSANDDAVARQPAAATSLSDPRVVQILATEHWSLLASRSLAYNEAFIRGGMFLTFLSTSFVGLALLAQAMSFSDSFLVVTVVVLAFDFVIGLLTFIRIAGTGDDDLRSVHGMARIRNAYTKIAPVAMPHFTTATHDDIASVVTAYGPPDSSIFDTILYGLSTSLGMIGLITAMVGGVLITIIALLFEITGDVALLLGAIGFVISFCLMLLFTFRSIARYQASLESRFPAATPQASEDEAA